ncbi:MAG: cytidylate kinase family protein, partial [Clostridia bacterium]|nr:cytidylate kinase family protein [Clostridia bacterium]
MDKKILVTVARQYGSGGREIGNRVAELLGIPLYDREIITGAAEAADLHPDVAEKEDERAASSLLYTLAMGAHFHIP